MQPNDRKHYEIALMGVELGLKLKNDELLPLVLGQSKPKRRVAAISWLRWWDEVGNLLLAGDDKELQAEAIAEQKQMIAEQEHLAKKEAEAISNQEHLIANQVH